MHPANLISALGLVSILVLAWAMSVHRSDVKLRPILWGLGLQFVFALIILREDIWSYIGMAVLALLIVAYQLHGATGRKGGWSATAARLGGFAVHAAGAAGCALAGRLADRGCSAKASAARSGGSSASCAADTTGVRADRMAARASVSACSRWSR